MISPAPEGVNPNSATCGCGARLTMPGKWVHRDTFPAGEFIEFSLRCTVAPDHDTYTLKHRGETMELADGREYNVKTQQPTDSLAPISDHSTALAHVEKANAIGMFPQKATPEQAAVLATVALAYRLDPYMGEIMPYQGKPYITIKGRRRLDAYAGNKPSIRFRVPTPDEIEYWQSVGATAPKDVIQICQIVDPVTGTMVEGIGRVLMSEDAAQTGNSRQHHPLVLRKLEMAQKRGEMRARDMMYGPVPRPAGMDELLQVTLEGDDAPTGVIEGDSQPVPEDNAADAEDAIDAHILAQGDIGTCDVHDGAEWGLQDRHGTIKASHRIDGTNAWCSFGSKDSPQTAMLAGAYRARFDDASTDKMISDWLKARYNDRTWSKLDPREMLDSIEALSGPLVDVATGAIASCNLCGKEVDDDDPGAPNHKACMDKEDI